MIKTILISLSVALGLFGLLLLGQGKQTADSHADYGGIDTLSASEIMYDFGKISMKDGLVDHVFKVTNTSNEDVYIKSIYTSCMCTNAYIQSAKEEKGPFGMEGMGYVPPAKETIRAGESRDVRVVYDPNAHGPAGVGSIDRFVYLIDANGKSFQMEIKALVTP